MTRGGGSGKKVYDISDWKAGAAGPVLPSYQPSVHGKLTVEGCAAACYAAKKTVAGVEGGSDCFCGSASDMGTPSAQARSLPDKAVCEAVPCDGNPKEKACGGKGTMACQFSCDRGGGAAEAAEAAEAAAAGEEEAAAQRWAAGGDMMLEDDGHLEAGHNPSTSYSMRIDVN